MHLASHVDALHRLGAAEAVFVDVQADDADVLLRAASDAAARLEASGLFRAVAGPATPDALRRTGQAIAAGVPLLLREDAYAELEARLEPDAVAERVEAGVARLLEPGGEARESTFRADPLDLAGLALRSALGSVRPAGFTSAAIPMSPDGRHVLVTAIAHAPMGDEAGGAAVAGLMAELVKDAPSGVRVDWLGGHRFYRANATAVQRDVGLVSALGIGLVLTVVWLSFRGLRSTAMAGLAALSACAMGAAAAAVVFGTVSGIALAFGAALSGLCVDYVLHLRASPRPGETDASAVRRTYVAVAPSVAIGAATSAASFLILLASPIEAHRQIGVIAAAATLGGLAFALVPGPLLAASSNATASSIVKRIPTDRLSGAIWRRLVARPGAALLVGCALVGASLLVAPDLEFESDLRRFEFKDHATLASEAAFTETWGDVLSPSLLVVEGVDQEDALRRSEALLDERVAGARLPWPSVVGVVPSERTQASRWARWTQFWSPDRRAALRGAIDAAAADLGLGAGAFTPFLDGIDRSPEPLTRATWEPTALRPLVERLLVRTDDEVWSVIPVPRGSAELRDPGIESALAVQRVTVLGGRSLAIAIAESTHAVLRDLAVPALVLVAGMLWLYYRCARRALLALLPLLGGMSVAAGALVVLGEPLSLMTLPVLIPTVGFAVDYGIFTIDALDEAAADAVAGAGILERRGGGVLAAAFSTAAGGVAMTAADHPAIRSIGLTLVLAVLSCLVVAWLVLPRLHGLRGFRAGDA